MEIIKETLWKRCLSTPTKPPVKNSNICLSETAYQHKGTRKKCKKTIQAAIIQWQRHCLMYKPHHIASPDRSRKKASFLSRGPVHCITPFCSDALVSPPNLYPPCFSHISNRAHQNSVTFLATRAEWMEEKNEDFQNWQLIRIIGFYSARLNRRILVEVIEITVNLDHNI